MPLMREELAQEIDEGIVSGGEVHELVDVFEAVLVVRIGESQILHVAVLEDGRDHVGEGFVLLQALELTEEFGQPLRVVRLQALNWLPISPVTKSATGSAEVLI